MPLSEEIVSRVAGLELNALNFSGMMPEVLEGARIRTAGTVVYDINGEPLFRRFPLSRAAGSVGYADVAVNESLGGPLLAASFGAGWNQRAILAEAKAAAAGLDRSPRFDSVRFVAYSYPKIALQFLKGKDEVLMLEWKSWAEVPPRTREHRPPMRPSNFARWSLLDEMPAAARRANATRLAERLRVWDTSGAGFDTSRIKRELFALKAPVIRPVERRRIRFGPHPNDHQPCYELRSQQTPVWCVAASTEMLLDFYRYGYDQVHLAKELGLGTCENPNGLPYSEVGRVVTAIENLTAKSLDVTMHTDPVWDVFRGEILANRPLISFIPGHSRTVAGYMRGLILLPGQLPFRGLLVYDPWPPEGVPWGMCGSPDVGGQITWENFDTPFDHWYQYAYSAVLQQV